MSDMWIMFLLFWDQSHVDKHRGIKFTVEIERNDSLPFLDVEVTRTGIYCKPIFSGVYGNYHSIIPTEYKFGLIMTLLVSDYTEIDMEIKQLKIPTQERLPYIGFY